MPTVLAEQDQRLDQIFFLAYRDSKTFDPAQFYAFLQANRHLLKTPILQGGETVSLPDFPRSAGRVLRSPLYWG